MDKLIDKLIIFLLCIAFYFQNASYSLIVVPILVAITISAYQSYNDNKKIMIAVFAFYILLCFYDPIFIFFLPLICYDILFIEPKYLCVLTFIPIGFEFIKSYRVVDLIIVSMVIVAFLLKYRSVSTERLQENYFSLRDKSKETALLFEQKSKELMEKQDYEVKLAKLNERNRIARDIHDNVGHMLSRSILQIGAFLAISKDESTKESIKQIKDNLVGAMDSIRSSVHDLHEKSIDLYTEIKTLIDSFEFCTVDFEYNIESDLDVKLKYCIIMVIKEALANIIKHSNATNVNIYCREHPAFLQLVVQDNGKKTSSNTEDGIGLKNIASRVEAFGGHLNINTNNGFRIFISIPKESSK